MDSKKAYDAIDRRGMWQMLRVYGVGGKLLKAVQSVWVGNDVSEWFPVNVMSPCLFNVYMDDVVREMNVRFLGKGLRLLECEWGQLNLR